MGRRPPSPPIRTSISSSRGGRASPQKLVEASPRSFGRPPWHPPGAAGELAVCRAFLASMFSVVNQTYPVPGSSGPRVPEGRAAPVALSRTFVGIPKSLDTERRSWNIRSSGNLNPNPNPCQRTAPCQLSHMWTAIQDENTISRGILSMWQSAPRRSPSTPGREMGFSPRSRAGRG
jgi:hypothetical protein